MIRKGLLNNKLRIAKLLQDMCATGDVYSMYAAKKHVIKRKLYLIQRGKCCFCSTMTMLDNGKLNNLKCSSTIEHVIPKGLGGESHSKNYKISCWRCNNVRKTIEFNEFYEMVQNYDFNHIIKITTPEKKSQEFYETKKQKAKEWRLEHLGY